MDVKVTIQYEVLLKPSRKPFPGVRLYILKEDGTVPMYAGTWGPEHGWVWSTDLRHEWWGSLTPHVQADLSEKAAQAYVNALRTEDPQKLSEGTQD